MLDMHDEEIKGLAEEYADLWEEISSLQDKENLTEYESNVLEEKKEEANRLQEKLQTTT